MTTDELMLLANSISDRRYGIRAIVRESDVAMDGQVVKIPRIEVTADDLVTRAHTGRTITAEQADSIDPVALRAELLSELARLGKKIRKSAAAARRRTLIDEENPRQSHAASRIRKL